MGRKKLYGYFHLQAGEIALKKTWIWPRKGNPKRETVSLLLAAQNNAIRTNYIEVKIDNAQRNTKCRKCREREREKEREREMRPLTT